MADDTLGEVGSDARSLLGPADPEAAGAGSLAVSLDALPQLALRIDEPDDEVAATLDTAAEDNVSRQCAQGVLEVVGGAGSGNGVAGLDAELAGERGAGVAGQCGLRHDGVGRRISYGLVQRKSDFGPVGVDGIGEQLAYTLDFGGVASDENEGTPRVALVWRMATPMSRPWEGRRPRSMRSASGGWVRRSRRLAVSSC